MICFCIPARFNSTRLKNKLLLPLNNNLSCIEKTCFQVKKSKYYTPENPNIFIFTDNIQISNVLSTCIQSPNIIITSLPCKNGTERIAKHIHLLSEKYDIVVNIQADEPFIDPLNIDEAISKHLEHNATKNNVFYTTLHEENNTHSYLHSTASLKLVTDINSNVLYYSRNIIPANKSGHINSTVVYKTFTGIYVYNKNKLIDYNNLQDTDLQNEEDCEQLKIIEHGFKIKSYPTKTYNEISLNTLQDYEFLKNKYAD